MDNGFAVFCAPLIRKGCGFRLVGAAVLLFVVLLPFHFHSAILSPQISKECSCYQGSRTQVGLAPVTADWVPIFQPYLFVSYEPRVLGWSSVNSRAIRAP